MMTISKENTKSKLIIRRVESTDFLEIHNIFSQPGVIRGTLQMPYPSLDTWKKRLAEPSEEYFALVACVDTSVVGFLGIKTSKSFLPRAHVGNLSMAVHDKWQRQGIGKSLLESALSTADNWLNLTRMELRVLVENQPALCLYRLYNFKIEGILRCFAFHNGEYKDAYCMARLNERLSTIDYPDVTTSG